ncbi:hypothetical protein [Cupriavidus sp. YAF13]|uniref:hypothetical protein n=1 Tax=Cupriavidus sp. YAF13 TaxID=3233075 RepID=UPI003F924324
MTPATIFSIIEQPEDGFDGIRFVVRVTQPLVKQRTYRGMATRNALLELGKGNSEIAGNYQAIFAFHKKKFEQRAEELWNNQEETVEYVIDQTNASDGGGFVNNG